jgi:hypothetical protein
MTTVSSARHPRRVSQTCPFLPFFLQPRYCRGASSDQFRPLQIASMDDFSVRAQHGSQVRMISLIYGTKGVGQLLE